MQQQQMQGRNMSFSNLAFQQSFQHPMPNIKNGDDDVIEQEPKTLSDKENNVDAFVV
jgi:hypothetical protein